LLGEEDERIFEHTMTVVNKKEPILLGIGDLGIMVISLFVALVVRYQIIPPAFLIHAHAVPFSIIFIYSLIVFYISGLYGRVISPTRSSIPGAVIRAQVANGLIAVALFYFVPGLVVAPKANLFIYIALSTSFLVLWRISSYSLISRRRKSGALVIGSGSDMDELVAEMSVNPRIGLSCYRRLTGTSPAADIAPAAASGRVPFQYIVADMKDRHLDDILPDLYQRFFPRVRIVDADDLYETVFDRIPLSRMNYAWIMTHVTSVAPLLYDAAKRLTDIVFGLLVGFAACVAWPFVALAVKLEDGGPVFISQERIGRGGAPIKIYKFRSMQRSEYGKWLADSDNKVTKIGRFIRKTRIDELPQALAILEGDMSIIGPRADLRGLSERLEKEIPYYSVRTVVAPGLTGWAQINQEKPPQSVEETKVRLSYDLYYIKHRSLGLDLRIILRTLKTLLSRVGM